MFVGDKAAPNIEGASEQLGRAKEQADNGKHMPHIFQQTDWFQNKDDKQWRREVSDKDMKMTGDLKKNGGSMRLDQAVKHDELFKAVPNLRCTTIESKKLSGKGNVAEYDPNKNHITVNNPKDMKSTAHEIQHAVQNDQNFPTGSRGADGSDPNYKNNRGEREARDVEARLNGQGGKPDLLHKSVGMKAG